MQHKTGHLRVEAIPVLGQADSKTGKPGCACGQASYYPSVSILFLSPYFYCSWVGETLGHCEAGIREQGLEIRRRTLRLRLRAGLPFHGRRPGLCGPAGQDERISIRAFLPHARAFLPSIPIQSPRALLLRGWSPCVIRRSIARTESSTGALRDKADLSQKIL